MSDDFYEDNSDDFLFDEDLLQEGLLSAVDAWGMFNRGELTSDQLMNYLEYKNQQIILEITKAEKKASEPNPVAVILIAVSIFLCMLIYGCVYSF